MKYRKITDPEAVVQAVFALPVELSHRDAAERIGCHHTTVAAIRCGQKFADVLPGIPRLDKDMAITCLECLQFNRKRIRTWNKEDRTIAETPGICELGIPESENIKFARGCGAFSKKPDGHP